jgi:asparagine synthase (glutamine-hydrolysing)
LVWDDADFAARGSAGVLAQRLRASSPEWRVQLGGKGLCVFCAGVRAGSSESYQLHDDAGVVVGKLFHRQAGLASMGTPLEIAEDESRKIVASGGRRLIGHYWGRYVAFIQDEAAGLTRVLRDPSAMLPCFASRMAGVDVYFSRMEDVSKLGGHRYSVNWKYVAATLRHSQLQVRSTGLNEVSQVLGGECVEHRGGHASRSFYWNALEVAQSDIVEDATEAADAMRAVTQDCVHAWASCYPGIVHMLSGGLDSSIILACLRQAPARPHMACLNYYSAGCNADERDYARLAANGSGCEVIERERNSELSLEPLLRIRESPSPADYFVYLDEGRCEAQLAREHGAGAIFSGYGGDQLFYRSEAWLGAGDFLMTHGVGPALFEIALDAARMDRTSVWNVLGKVARDGMLRRRWSLQAQRKSARKTLLREDVAQDISRDSDLVHPWIREPGRAPNGKIFHAYQLLFPGDFYNPLGADTDPELVTPLFSQPLLELAMRIPTWLLTRGGWDRAMARRAFEHELPRRIVTRRTKGGQEEHAKAILVRNVTFARELLLDGRLVRERILERDQVAEVLTPGPARFGSGNAQLYGCLSTEAWVRQWCA